ncbi:MAG TPA: hypothetical protein VEA15_02220 [Caulobacteraceae bacterium]|nr:hypothetical protein [Caulobacteraceae bacterium]
MAAKRKGQKTRPNEIQDRLTFVAPEAASFAYIELDDEFEIPPIPQRYALSEARVAFRMKQPVERW